ncbi:MAG: hypothetical protein RDU01_04105 [Thermodesulfovibrionales bacterium]|nr:hypothetical protein [Thermodesulfovibrionales bacterium]
MKTAITEIKIEGDLLLNPDDYDYMDSLPIEGWIWEFIRRNLKYREIYSDFRERKVEKAGIHLKLKEVREEIAIRPVIAPCKKLNPQSFLRVKIPNFDNCAGLPNYDLNAHDFVRSARCLPPIIGLTPIILYKPDKYERRGIKIKGRRVPLSTRHYVSKEYCDEIINNILPPVDVRNTLYVGISEYANKEHVRRELESIVHNWVEQREVRLRDEAWRVSLFIYDLFEKLETKYTKRYMKFTAALVEAYPKFVITRYRDGRKRRFVVNSRNYFDESKCRRFYHNAKSLIEDDYKRFLYLK